MRHCRNLILPIALAAAAPAQATQVCAWIDETIEIDQAGDSYANAGEAAAAAAEAADAVEAAVEAALDDPEAMAAEAQDAATSAAEAVEEDYADLGLHSLKLWLEADADVSFLYKMAGEGMVQDEGGHAHAPNSGTFVLSRGEPSSPWGFGMTLYPPGRIDVVIQIHAWPEDIFAEEDPPLLATFIFERRIPEGETQPPPTLAARQCQDITFPPRSDSPAD